MCTANKNARQNIGPAIAILGGLLALMFVLFVPRPLHGQQDGRPAATSSSENNTASDLHSGVRGGDPAQQPEARESGDPKDEYRLSASTKWIAARLHMDPRWAALLFDLLNFAVLVGFIVFALKKVLPAMFRSRDEKLQGQLIEARAATLDARHRLDVVEQRLGKLDDEIVALRGRAEIEMRAEEERFRDSLEREKTRIVENAEQEIAAAGAAARRELKKLAADLAVGQAERNLNLTPDMDRELVNDFAAQLGSRN